MSDRWSNGGRGLRGLRWRAPCWRTGPRRTELAFDPPFVWRPMRSVACWRRRWCWCWCWPCPPWVPLLSTTTSWRPTTITGPPPLPVPPRTPLHLNSTPPRLTLVACPLLRWHDTGAHLHGRFLSGPWHGVLLHMTSQAWLSSALVDRPVWTHHLVVLVSLLAFPLFLPIIPGSPEYLLVCMR